MRVLVSFLLALPLAVMLIGLLAAVLPVPWESWLMVMLLGALLLWMLLTVVGVLPRRAVVGVGLLAGANVLAWLLLQTTSLYGGAV